MQVELEAVNLSDVDFWMRSRAERLAAYGLLRRERPMVHFAEPELASPMPMPSGPG